MSGLIPGPSDLAPAVRRALLALQAQITNAVASVGDIKMSGRSTAPSGWLGCDGAAVSRTVYADLFAAIGTSFGVGDGSTTFNVPDLRGRAPIGSGTGSGLTARAIGATVGVESVTLTAAESGLPAHNHTQNAHTHTQNPHQHSYPGAFNVGAGAGATALVLNVIAPQGTSADTATNQDTTATNIANAAAAAAAAHTNMQPSVGVLFVIRY